MTIIQDQVTPKAYRNEQSLQNLPNLAACEMQNTHWDTHRPWQEQMSGPVTHWAPEQLAMSIILNQQAWETLRATQHK